MDQTTKFLCPFCRRYILKTEFEQHRLFHWNDHHQFPDSLEELKQRFEMLGLYDEQ